MHEVNQLFIVVVWLDHVSTNKLVQVLIIASGLL